VGGVCIPPGSTEARPGRVDTVPRRSQYHAREPPKNVYIRTPGGTSTLGAGPVDGRHLKLKICLVGEVTVGKTSLIRRFVLDDFDDKYIQTLGTKVSKKEVVVPGADGGVPVDMTIWDIMGQKGFRELLRDAYFYGAKGIMAVCDVTRRSTLDDLDDWIEGVYSVTGQIPIQFLANKIDLKPRAVIDEVQLVQAAKAYDAPFLFTSAKTGENVEAAFQALARRIAIERPTIKAA